MKYMNAKNISIILGIIILLGTVVLFNKTNTPSEEVVIEEAAITTDVEETIATTTTAGTESSSEPIKEKTVSTGAPKTTTSKTPLKVTIDTQPVPPEKIELGPRLPATTSPMAALDYFAEAMKAGDYERALSYFAESVKEGYRTSFKKYEEKSIQHPVVTAYFSGTVGDVELTQPEHGIYEIRVTPHGSTNGYSLYFFFENGEFVIWEL